MRKEEYINLHYLKEEKKSLEFKYHDFFMRRYINYLLENKPIEKLNIDFLIDILEYYSTDEYKLSIINQEIKKYILLLENKRFNKITKEDKKIIVNYIEKAFKDNLDCLIDTFLDFLSTLLKYIIYKEEQDEEIIVHLINDCFMYLTAFSNWKEFKFHPGRKINRFHRNSYYALEYIKSNYDELYKKALEKIGIKIKDEYLNLVSLNELLKYKNEYYFVHKYIYSKVAKDYYFKKLDKNDI